MSTRISISQWVISYIGISIKGLGVIEVWNYGICLGKATDVGVVVSCIIIIKARFLVFLLSCILELTGCTTLSHYSPWIIGSLFYQCTTLVSDKTARS